ncbi:MAG: HlyD family secretion protein [Prolixibacteraceae bacterium]
MDKGNNIELRTDEVRDILQKMPHWTIRWGISLIAASMALLLLFSYFYRYPDLIHSEVLITASNPPAEVKARSAGKIISLLVNNDDYVSKGQDLAVIENAGNISHVREVQQYMDHMGAFIHSFDEKQVVEVPQHLLLGDIQSSFSNFKKVMTDYVSFLHRGFYVERISSIEAQIELKNISLNRLKMQKEKETERFELASKSFQRDSQLFRQSIISREAFEDSRSKAIGADLTLEAVQKEWINIRSLRFELMQQKAALQMENDIELEAHRSLLVKTADEVKNAIQTWYFNYVLTSPIDGMASFNKVWAQQQNVSLGETVFIIVPEKPMDISAKAFISEQGAGKVKVGQKVNIKLNNYPYMEYGMLKGFVTRIASVPMNKYYTVEIELPQQLTTNYGRTLEMKQELSGNCEIITDDLRLIQRMIYPIKAIVERNKR